MVAVGDKAEALVKQKLLPFACAIDGHSPPRPAGPY